MQQDIRDMAYIDHDDVVGLNFIRSDGRYVFRRHFRQGLRSHIMEVLAPDDVMQEQTGVTIDGMRQFPKARPRKMLRIFRTRFSTLDEVLAEIQRVKVAEKYLTPEFVAQSIEIIVDYQAPAAPGPLLCGLQEYVTGVILDPWSTQKSGFPLRIYYDSLRGQSSDFLLPEEDWVRAVCEHGRQFVGHVKKMITEGGHIPDLAGVGNVFFTPEGRLKLVDINNISKVVTDENIHLDDKGYPVCDKSIEALALIEEKLLGRERAVDPIYTFFLAPDRKEQVDSIEKKAIAGLHLKPKETRR